MDDPLNWPPRNKHLILFTVAWAALTADFASASGSAPIILQAVEWHKSVGTINQTNSISVLMMAVGGLIWVPMTSFIGRAPALFWSTFFGLVFSIVTAVSPNFPCFHAIRAMSGLFLTSGQTIAVAFIKDIFFFHDRARKNGLWALIFGIMCTSVAVTAYVLDSYPSAPAEVSGWTNIARAMSGFSVGYFQEPWGSKVGYDASFGTQAAIFGASMILIGIVHRYGHVLRLKSSQLR
ncbi:hypothetical protein CEP54_015352 [Fusarium duplospermum]|uniref:Major facilitator superfamily (MFS) profile domain-containing protein n=1 Tax=Fusarium duplospermum TaxID=1325734 RepID=A0A428NPS2_9HYPO|nr:hypothetical protein CEP54_015352 [Fusarium duplospermum]